MPASVKEYRRGEEVTIAQAHLEILWVWFRITAVK